MGVISIDFCIPSSRWSARPQMSCTINGNAEDKRGCGLLFFLITLLSGTDSAPS